MTDAMVILVTAGSEKEATDLAEALVGEGLAACVNLVRGVGSIYRWQGTVCRDDEVLLVVKSTRARFADIETRIRALHSYEVPEVIGLPIELGSGPYLAWIAGETMGS